MVDVMATRGLPRKKAGGRGGAWLVEVEPGRWVREEEVDPMKLRRVTLPTNPPGPVERRFEAPESPGSTIAPSLRPSEKQREAWDLVVGQGLTQIEAADTLEISQAGVQQRLKGYMAAMGLDGPLPGLLRDRAPAPATIDAPGTSSPGAAQDEPSGGGESDPDGDGAVLQPPDPTPPDPEPAAERVPSAAGDGPTEAPPAPGPTTPLRCAFCGCSEAAPCAEGCALVPDPQGLGAPCCEACGRRVTAPPRMPWVDDELDRLRGVLAELERREDAITDLIERLEAVRDGYARLRTLSAA